MAAQLSPPTQALLQTIDTIQPATTWNHAQQSNTVTFIPTEIDYNPLRLQSQPYTLMIHHPTNLTTPEYYFTVLQDSEPTPEETTHGPNGVARRS